MDHEKHTLALQLGVLQTSSRQEPDPRKLEVGKVVGMVNDPLAVRFKIANFDLSFVLHRSVDAIAREDRAERRIVNESMAEGLGPPSRWPVKA